MKLYKKIIAIILGILLITYISYTIYLLIVNPTNTYIIKQGTISQEDSSTGYVIRNETVIKGEDYENGIYSIITEGEKVAKNDSIFRYYSNSEKEISEKISEIDYQIQELLDKEGTTDVEKTADVKSIENSIEEKISNIKELNNYQEITEYKNNIDNLISKKINFLGDTTSNSEIKKLVQQRKEYEESIKNGAKYITAPMSGIVSYRVDGLEEEFSTGNFNNMTEENLEKIELRTGQIIAKSNESGKIIDNFECYIAVLLDSEQSMNAKVGDKVQLRLSNQDVKDATIEQINEGSKKRTIIFKINEMTEDLINHRKIAVDVIWWNKTGLKVPNQALIEENGLYYVIKNKAGIETKMLVKIEKQTDRFSIISNYSLKDLQEIGYDEKEIKNYKKIKNYDEIILQ